jgi:hypothetical protein
MKSEKKIKKSQGISIFNKIMSISIFSFMNCCGPKIDIYKQVIPQIELKEAVTIASAFLDSTCCKGLYIKDSVRVWEWSLSIESWNVEFNKNNWQNIRPSTIIVAVDKVNGKASLILQE